MSEAKLRLVVTGETFVALSRLRATGLFGTTLEDVAERLLLERLRELVEDHWTEAFGDPGDAV